MVRAIEGGFVQREIQEASYRYQLEVEKEERIVVGVNKFRTEEEMPVPITRIDKAVEDAQIRRLDKLREERDGAKADKALARLADAARGKDNLMEPIVEAVEAYATIGEIADTLREVFGEYKEQVVL